MLSLSTLLFTFCIAGPAFQSERTERKKGGKANERKDVAQQSPPHRELAAGRSLPAAQESQSQSRSQSQSQTQFQSLCHLRAEHQKCTASERAETRQDFFEFAYLCWATNLNIVMRATKDMKRAQDNAAMPRRVYTLTIV